MLLTAEARMPDGMRLIWYCTKHLTGQMMLRHNGWYVSVSARIFGMIYFCDRKSRLQSNWN